MTLLSHLRLVHLRFLANLGETRAIGLAGARVGLEPTAASRLMAEIERLVGQSLHRRVGRGTALTAVGEALTARAVRMLAELGAAEREVAALAGGHIGHVRVGAVTGPALTRLLPALQRMRANHSGFSAHVEVGTSDVLGDQLLAGQLDLALCRRPDSRAPGLFATTPLGQEPVAMLVRAGHPLLAEPAPVRAEALLAHDWVMPPPSALISRTVLAALDALGLPHPRVPVSTSSFLMTVALIADSDAVAPISADVAPVAGRASGATAVLPTTFAPTVPTWGIVTLDGAVLTPAAQRLADLIRAPG